MKGMRKRRMKRVLAVILITAIVLQTGFSPVTGTSAKAAESSGTANGNIGSVSVETSTAKKAGDTAQASSDNLSEDTSDVYASKK